MRQSNIVLTLTYIIVFNIYKQQVY